jgi:hypothetical protein
MATGTKIGLILAGILGLVGCFLPLVDLQGHAVSFWDLHEHQLLSTLIVLAGYALGAAMGVASLVRAPMQKWQAQLAFAGFAVAGIKFARHFYNVFGELSVGGILMLVAAGLGLVCGGIAIAKPESA